MGYALLADLVMVVHFAFLGYLALGGYLAWWHSQLLAPHVGAATWGAVSATVGLPCPLTGWEDAARRAAGGEGLPGGFIDTYLTGVVYPEEHLRTVQLAVAALVLVSWAGLAVRARATRRPAPRGMSSSPS